MCEHGGWTYVTVSPLLLVKELLPSVSWASLSLDSNLVRDSLTDSYFLLPMANLGPEDVTASVVPGCSQEQLNSGWPAFC